MVIRLNKDLEEVDNFTKKVDEDAKNQGFIKASNPDGFLPINLKIFKDLMRDMVYPLYSCPICGYKYLVIRYFYRKGTFVPHYCCTKCNTIYEISNFGTLRGKKLR